MAASLRSSDFCMAVVDGCLSRDAVQLLASFDAASTVSIVCRSTWPLLRKALHFLRPEFDFERADRRRPRPTTVGTDRATSRMP